MTKSANIYQGYVCDVEKLSPAIFRITIDIPEICFSALPGQFVMVQTIKGNDPLLRRPFSIHRLLEDGRIQLLFREIGKGTNYLSLAKKGDSLSVLGPLGRPFSLPEQDDDAGLCLVGGGIGIAPLLFLAEHSRKQNTARDVAVFLGARNRHEHVITDDFRRLGLMVEEISDDGSCGKKGVVCDLLNLLPKPGKWFFYGCGPEPMLRSLAKYCRDNLHPCQVSLETVMACGFGACLGCVTPGRCNDHYLHVCVDGPVFNLEDLSW